MPFFDLGSMELLLIAVVALIVVGPKDLPKLMRTAGRMMGKLRGTARHFKSGIDEMIRQSELEEMQEKWAKHNQTIMTGPPMPGAATSQESPGDGDHPSPSDIKSASDTIASEIPPADPEKYAKPESDGDSRKYPKP